ncbi:hypothetical protein CDL60_04520 [Roseateles noduli]|nr:hypothetical protein CDL60_04520 [Roseateles noduli]
MTIVIAVALPDAIVMVADGRHSNSIEVVSDSAQKIFSLNESQILGVCGAVIGTEMAIAKLSQSAPSDAESLGNQLAYLSRVCAEHVIRLVTADTEGSKHLKVGLIAGGFSEGRSFLAGGLFGSGMVEPDRQVRYASSEEPQQMVLGGEEVGSVQYFIDRLTDELRLRVQSGPVDAEVWVAAIIRAAELTIRHVAEHDSTVGGRISYRVLRRKQAEESGNL